MKLLELFSGTGSVGKVAKELGYDVVSLDLKDANINTDILNWDYKQFNRNNFQIIWASPPCVEYSIAKTTGVRKIDYANSIVQKTIEIIRYFNPSVWFIENPQTGLLKHQEFMKDFDYFDIDYCKYGFPYRKRKDMDEPKNLETEDHYVKKIVETSSTTNIKKQPNGCRRVKRANGGDNPIIHRQDELYRIPSDLVNEIFSHILLV